MRYHEHHAYSPLLDCAACRLSVYDDRGGEFYMIVATEQQRGDEARKSWRVRRNEALDLIEQAIDQGSEPGEVRVR